MKRFNSTLNSYKPLKAKKGLTKISKKQKQIKNREGLEAQNMLELCGGKCMICGKATPLEPNHTRDRTLFILSCHECHFPNGYHKYLDEWGDIWTKLKVDLKTCCIPDKGEETR
jgi:hypothetical protein